MHLKITDIFYGQHNKSFVLSRGGKEKMEKIFFRSDAICETLRNGRLVRRGQVILSCRGV